MNRQIKTKDGIMKQLLHVMTLAFLGLLVIAAPSLALDAGALPIGGQITAGSGVISQYGTHMTIDQASQQMIANWSTFNIGADSSVSFNQPNRSAVALNRIQDQSPSQILGSLSANGQIFLLNPSGIIFGQTAQVDVGGLVASSLDLSDEDFLAGNNVLSTTEAAGTILNQGNIRTSNGGYVAFLAPKVENTGTIDAPKGTVALAAGNKVSLDFNGDQLVTYTVEQGAIDALVENHGLIKADGGLVMMTAAAADQLTNAVVNNDGVIQAQTLENLEGRILLLADMENGTTTVAGTLNASAPNGGDGGFIETSAAHVQVAEGTTVTTLAIDGHTGEWLIDPPTMDYTIAADGGDITGETLSANLGTTNVTILSTDGASGTNGDINVKDAVSWYADTTLTLTATNDVNVNADITATGDNASLVLNPGGSYTLLDGVSITLSGNTPSLSIGGNVYTVINNVTALQNMNLNLAGFYALGSDIDATVTATWNAGAGFAPVGSTSSYFTGQFDGLGHTISGLTIYRPAQNYVGLFGAASGNSVVLRNVGLLNANVSGNNATGGLVAFLVNGGDVIDSNFSGTVTGQSTTGGLVGSISGSIIGSHATGTVTGTEATGGLAGYVAPGSLINDSYATATVSGGNYTGGLVGYNETATISGSYATGAVSGGDYTGGLIGFNHLSSVDNSYAIGTVSGGNNVGGLIGYNDYLNTISNSYATGAVSGTAANIGGLLGYNYQSSVDNSYATGVVSGDNNVGGLIGRNYYQGPISNSYATGDVSGVTVAGGLVGYNRYSSINSSYATGNVSGDNNLGGLVAYSYSGAIDNCYATGSVTGVRALGGLLGAFDFANISNSYASGAVSGNSQLGGLAGYAQGLIDNTYATGNVSGTSDFIGGLVGENHATISSSHATGAVSGGNRVGGLVGHTYSSINNSYAMGNVLGTGGYVGGLAGINDAWVYYSYATGNVVGATQVGGLTGHSNYGGMYEVFAAGPVTGDQYVGGLSGSNYGHIYDSYATGSVSGDQYIGGLTGYNNNYGWLERTYATGLITLNAGGSYAGGLVGWTYSGSRINDSYWDMQTTGQSAAIGLNWGGNSATGLTTPEMMQQASFTNFDFTNIWRIYEGYSYPVLRSLQQQSPLTVTANNDNKTYDGLSYSGGNGVTYSVASASLTGTLTYSGTSQGAADVGTYTITPQVAMSQLDYQSWADVSFVDGTLTIENNPTQTNNVIAGLMSPQGSLNGTQDDQLDSDFGLAIQKVSMGPDAGSRTLDEITEMRLMKMPACNDSLRDTVFCR